MFQFCGVYFPSDMKPREEKLTKFWAAFLHFFAVTGILVASSSFIVVYFEDFAKFSFLLSIYVAATEVWLNASIFIFEHKKINQLTDLLRSKNSQPKTKIERYIERSIYFKTHFKKH